MHCSCSFPAVFFIALGIFFFIRWMKKIDRASRETAIFCQIGPSSGSRRDSRSSDAFPASVRAYERNPITRTTTTITSIHQVALSALATPSRMRVISGSACSNSSKSTESFGIRNPMMKATALTATVISTSGYRSAEIT